MYSLCNARVQSVYIRLLLNGSFLLSQLTKITESNSYKSVFLCPVDEIIKKSFIDSAKKNNETYFNDEDWPTFLKSVENVLDVFNTSDGQIPLSPCMQNRLNKLQADLLKIVKNGCITQDNSLPSIANTHNEFIGNIDKIICEIKKTTPALLKPFWNEIDKLKKSHNSN